MSAGDHKEEKKVLIISGNATMDAGMKANTAGREYYGVTRYPNRKFLGLERRMRTKGMYQTCGLMFVGYVFALERRWKTNHTSQAKPRLCCGIMPGNQIGNRNRCKSWLHRCFLSGHFLALKSRGTVRKHFQYRHQRASFSATRDERRER